MMRTAFLFTLHSYQAIPVRAEVSELCSPNTPDHCFARFKYHPIVLKLVMVIAIPHVYPYFLLGNRFQAFQLLVGHIRTGHRQTIQPSTKVNAITYSRNEPTRCDGAT